MWHFSVLFAKRDKGKFSLRFGTRQRCVLNELTIACVPRWRMMSPATGFLTLDQFQLLADCVEPVLVLELPAAAETLIERGLLVSSQISLDPLPCHVLAITEQGRTCVTSWVKQQERS